MVAEGSSPSQTCQGSDYVAQNLALQSRATLPRAYSSGHKERQQHRAWKCVESLNVAQARATSRLQTQHSSTLNPADQHASDFAATPRPHSRASLGRAQLDGSKNTPQRTKQQSAKLEATL